MGDGAPDDGAATAGGGGPGPRCCCTAPSIPATTVHISVANLDERRIGVEAAVACPTQQLASGEGARRRSWVARTTRSSAMHSRVGAGGAASPGAGPPQLTLGAVCSRPTFGNVLRQVVRQRHSATSFSNVVQQRRPVTSSSNPLQQRHSRRPLAKQAARGAGRCIGRGARDGSRSLRSLSRRRAERVRAARPQRAATARAMRSMISVSRGLEVAKLRRA